MKAEAALVKESKGNYIQEKIGIDGRFRCVKSVCLSVYTENGKKKVKVNKILVIPRKLLVLKYY